MDDDQGYVPLALPSQRKQATPIPAPTPNSAPSGDGQGYVPLAPPGQRQGQQTPTQQTPASAQPSPGWGISGWSGDVSMPQAVQDWGNVAGNEAGTGVISLMGQKAQLDAARQRLGPVAAASADVAGNLLSPTTLLNAVGGPELAGAAHEGVKSAATNWNTNESWGDYLKRVGEDTALGAGWGGLGRAGAAMTPGLARLAATAGPPAGAGIALHALLGHGDLAREATGWGGTIAGTIPLTEMLNNFGKDVQSRLANSPAARQAIQNLILSGGSALRTGAGPYYDQWIPGQ
jgi:hypothetical protein